MAQAPPLPAVDEREPSLLDPPPSGAPSIVSRPLVARLRRGSPRSQLLAVLTVVVVLVVALLVWRATTGGPAPLTTADVNRQVAAGLAKAAKDASSAPPDASLAYQTIQPSLVTITTQSKGESALGAGVVIDAQGEVLTALHVVSGGGPVRVRFADGTQSIADVVKRQPESDIAVLAPQRLPSVVVPAVMAGSPEIGTAVFPVGNPLGLIDSLSAGVVSALDRSIAAPGGRTLKGLIQFDAAVNPGNSGGPLLDRAGHVVGIVTALANPAQQPYFVGIGFAVPIATAGGAAGGPSK